MATRDAAVLTVSVAAELAGMHPQTVRQYDRLGLVEAKRTRGGGRRYSLNDVDRLLEIQRLSQEEGINLAGIAHIMSARDREEKLRKQIARLEKVVAQQSAILEQHRQIEQRVFAVGGDGDVLVVPRDKLREVLQAEKRSAIVEATQEYIESTRRAARRRATSAYAQREYGNRAAEFSDSSSVHGEYLGSEEVGTGSSRITGELIIWRPRVY